MKGIIKFIIMGAFLGLYGCTLGVNEVNPQTSKTAKDSKKDDLFISEYTVIQEPKGLFDIVEIWEEKVWYNKIVNLFKKTKILSENNLSWILIKTKEMPKLRYVYANYSREWQLSEPQNLTYSVGYTGGLIAISLKQTVSSPDSLLLILKKGQEEVGTLTLIRKP